MNNEFAMHVATRAGSVLFAPSPCAKGTATVKFFFTMDYIKEDGHVFQTIVQSMDMYGTTFQIITLYFLIKRAIKASLSKTITNMDKFSASKIKTRKSRKQRRNK